MKQIIRKKAAAKVVGKPGRPMSPAARVSNAQIGVGGGIGTSPAKFVPQVRKK